MLTEYEGYGFKTITMFMFTCATCMIYVTNVHGWNVGKLNIAARRELRLASKTN